MMRRPNDKIITLRDGAGGRAMRALIDEVFLDGAEEVAGGVGLADMDDGAALPVEGGWLVLTTDSHVVKPRFFAGGDIGRLAIAGTINDLAMMGATSRAAITCGLILEEGLPREELVRVYASMRATLREAGAVLVTGDTKVMGKGEVDGLIINTTGAAFTAQLVRDNGLRVGDRILVTGTVGDHGFAVLAARQALELEGALRSDVAPINGLVREAMLAGGDAISAMKDPTRGGVASALHELAHKSRVGILLVEGAVPLSDAVRAAAELLGIDPLHVANEGKALIGVRPAMAERVLQALRAHPLGAGAAIIGTAIDQHLGRVILDTGFGKRLLAEPEGEPMPRIC